MSDVREHVVSPAREDGFVRGLSELIGGPRGDHAVPETPSRGGRFWTAARIVLALTCLTLALHWVQKSPCRDGAWSDHKQYTNFCYTDVLALYYAEHLNEGQVPYLEYPVEYPVLTGAFMGALGLPIHALGEKDSTINQAQYFYDTNAFVLSLFAIGTVAMILSLRRRRPWDAALFALSPVLLVTATVNWDLLAIILAVAGMWFWARRYPATAGVMLGLGTAAKLWPLFLFGPIIIIALRRARDVPSPERPSGEDGGAGAWLGWAGGMVAAWWRRRPLGPALQVFAAIVVTWLVVNVPVMMVNMQNWRRFLDLNTERVIDWGTSWYVARHFDPFGLEIWNDVPRVTDLSLAVFIACCVGLLLLGLFAKTPPRLAQLAFLVVAIFLITNKVWSQQFTLWLLPLIVLARPKWRAFLAWQIAEVCYFLAFYGELMGASGKQVITEPIFILASLLRLGTVIMLVVLVIRDILRPEGDVVRQAYPEIGDPDGGLFNDFRLGASAPVHKEGPLPERSGPSPEFTADRPPVVSSV